MAITIGKNIPSLAVQRRLAEAGTGLAAAYERLSSGLRINRASDDAAGLAIAASLNSDRRVFAQGVRNLNDGLSLLNIADGTIEGLSQIVVRLQELAEQSANGVLGAEQRLALNEEGQALADEYFRIVRTTEFNGLKVFDASFGELRLQAGYGLEGGIASGLGGALGTGTFGTSTTYSTPAGPSEGAALGDLNGDGAPDLVTGYDNNGSGAVGVRLGLGDGSFRATDSYSAESGGTTSVTLADLDGDGTLDLITAGLSATGGCATVRLGRGDGTFGAAASYVSEPVHSDALAIADLNGDGVLDLATGGTNGGAGIVNIRLGLGEGSFGAATSYQLATRAAQSLAFDDINGDGILDMAIGERGFATIKFGLGDGRFGPSTSYAAESTASYGLQLGDLNGDGLIDLVTTGSDAGGGYTTVRLGQADGTFGGAVGYAAEANGSRDVQLGDLNGDGALDLVTAGTGGAAIGLLTVRLGLGDGTFADARSYHAEGANCAGVALGDINGDGVLDIAAAGGGAASGHSSVLLALTQEGVSPLLPFDISTMSGARQALPVFQRKLNQLAVQRGEIGAFQARIGVAINTLRTTSENSAAAASRIMDADVAHESAELLRRQILQQSSAAVLSQANQQPALALRLLQSLS